jgi:hypothetical protein
MEKATGAALALVTLARTVLAAIDESPASGTVAHAGALEAPVDTIVCPDVEPAGFKSWMGESVVANAIEADATTQRLAMSLRRFFMDISLESGELLRAVGGH